MRFRLIYLYIFKRFCINLAMCLFSSLALYIVVDYVGNIRKFSEVSLLTVATYYFFQIPYIVNLIFSIAMLLASMFTMGMLAKNSEITAMRAAGISIFSITRPIVYLAIVCTVCNIAFNETLMPRINQARQRMYTVYVKKQELTNEVSRRNFFYVGRKNVIFHFKGSYDAVRKRGDDVEIEFYQAGRLWKRVSCRTLAWENNAWVAIDGSVRTFFSDSLSTDYFTRLTDFPAAMEARPAEILKERKQPDEMNFAELKGYIDSMKRTGEDPMKIESLRADLHFKVSLPFITIIVVMFGVSLTVKVGKSGVAKVFGVGLLIGFIYYFFMKLGLGFGKSGALHPIIGAWLGNIIFFPLSAGYFFRVSKLE